MVPPQGTRDDHHKTQVPQCEGKFDSDCSGPGVVVLFPLGFDYQHNIYGCAECSMFYSIPPQPETLCRARAISTDLVH